MILIDAVYINAGGGKALLQALLGMMRGRTDVALLRDIRAEGLDTCGLRVFDLPHGERARARFYAAHAGQIRRALCFGNVPPPRRLAATTTVYFHNMLLCQSERDLGWPLTLHCWLKMAYIRYRRGNADGFLVQSTVVAEALRGRLGAGVEIRVAPFYAPSLGAAADSPGRWGRYAYVSNASPHKNHGRLLEAWRRLAVEGIRPELHLTIHGDFPELDRQLTLARAAGAQVINHGFTDPRALYALCGFQIYPSLSESFGLGLVEAAEAGCAVIASDRSYARSVIEPLSTFDPMSVDDIAAAVGRTYNRPAVPSVVTTPNRLDDIVRWLASGEPIT